MAKKKNSQLIRLERDVKSELFSISKELSRIESRTVSMGEVLRRILSAPDIRQRLKQGAMERKMAVR